MVCLASKAEICILLFPRFSKHRENNTCQIMYEPFFGGGGEGGYTKLKLQSTCFKKQQN